MIEYTVRVSGHSTKWYLNGNLHRKDGPAIEYANGEKHWYLNGLLHRGDGPACESSPRSVDSWYLNGKLHRADGPAITFFDGEKHWYLNGTRYSEEEWQIAVNPKITMTVAEIEAALGYKIKIVS
jgi:hypothetical protein